MRYIIMSKICCFFNYNPFYRYPIYKAMSEAYDCDFYFGDNAFTPLKQFDACELKGFKSMLHAMQTKFKEYVWHVGCLKLISTRYSHYIITGENLIIADWLIMLWARMTGKKVLMWTHGIHEHYPKWTTRVVLKLFYTQPDILLMYANYNWKYMKEMGCRDKQKRVIHNSLDSNLQTRLFNEQKKSDIYEKHFGNRLPTVIYIGRLQTRKKIDQLLKAISILKKNGNEHNLVLVGENVDSDILQKIYEEEGIEKNVWMYGPSYKEETNAELLYNADVCVCPAAVGLTAIHSMSYGTPVISNDNIETQMPEFESIIEGKTGSLFKEDDIEDLARHIERWTKKSDEERNVIRKDCRNIIDKEWSVAYQMEVIKEAIS